MRRKSLLWLFPLLLIAGCIEFESQNVTYTYNAAKDTLKIFSDYHGIFGADSADKISAEELKQLDSVLNTQRTFFFCNWISEFNEAQLREQLKDMENSAKDAPLKPAQTHVQALLKLLVDNVKVKNGRFYLDSAGKLSAVQFVTVTHVSKLIAAGNVVLRDTIQEEADKADGDALEKDVYRKSAERQVEYIKLEGNHLTLRFPATQKDFDEWMAPDSGKKQADEFKKSGGKITFANNEAVFSIGSKDVPQVRLTESFSAKPYSTNLLTIIRQRNLIKNAPEPDGTAKEFLSGN